ncbi:MAG: hypothetical protein J6K26_08180 [Lachnospiraceae bacterium]|nr:hypothetical protein [Lachnospiraceae bacterium]
MIERKRLDMSTDRAQKRNWYYVMMAVNAVFFFLLHLTFVGFTNDDSFFVVVRSQWDSLLDLLVYRYQTDSSRVLSEALLFTLIRMPFIVWQILDTLICILVFHSLTVLLVNDQYSKGNILVFLAFASYPYMHVGSAGWICTSLNYMWPLATLLYTLSGAFRRYRGEKVPAWKYFFYLLAAVFTANCEQPATMLVMTFGMALVFACMDKRSKWYEIVMMLIGVAGILFAMLAPGNGERTVMEAENWMPEFFNLTFSDKARLCSVFVFEHFVAIPDVIFFLFSLLLLLCGWQTDKEKTKAILWNRVIASVPLGIDVLFTGYYFVKDFLIGHKTNYDFSTPAIYMTDWKIAILQISEVAGLVVFIIAAVYTIWQCIPDLRKKLAMIWALGCGFAVRMALMLSPTMFSSWHRTLIFMYFAFLYCIVILAGMCKKKWIKRLIYGILIIGVIVNLILTVGLQIRKAL